MVGSRRTGYWLVRPWPKGASRERETSSFYTYGSPDKREAVAAVVGPVSGPG